MCSKVYLKVLSVIFALSLSFSTSITALAEDYKELVVEYADSTIEESGNDQGRNTVVESNDIEVLEDENSEVIAIEDNDNDVEDNEGQFMSEGKSEAIPDFAIAEGIPYDMGDTLKGQIYKWIDDDNTEHVALHIYGEYGYVVNTRINNTKGLKEYLELITDVYIDDQVTEIGKSVFSGCVSLKNVVLPSHIMKIGNSAFANCSSLVAIELPNSLEIIDEYAFKKCKKLSDVILPDSLSTIGAEAFNGCESICEIIIPKGVTNTGRNIFANCISLSRVVFAEGMVRIPNYALATSSSAPNFVGHSYIKEIVLPISLKEIGREAFTGLEKLEIVSGAGNISAIGFRAFYCCRNVESIPLNEGMVSIGEAAFYNCESITNVTIPSTVTEMGVQVFDGCSSLMEVSFAEGMVSIPADAFHVVGNGCVRTVNLPSTVRIIGDYAFKGQKKLAIINYNGCQIEGVGDGVFCDCENLQEIELPDSLVYIGKGAFRNCSRLSSIIIPKNVTSIGGEVFTNCKNLKDITFAEGIKVIPDKAFYVNDVKGTGYLKIVNIPSTLTVIGKDAFYGQNQIEYVKYNGTKENSGKISINTGNDSLVNAEWMFTSSIVPGDDPVDDPKDKPENKSEDSVDPALKGIMKNVKIAGFKTIVNFTGNSLTLSDLYNSNDKTCNNAGWNEVTLYVVNNKTKVKTPLVEGRDYTVTIGNRSNVGKVPVTFTGIGGFTGTIKKTVTIKALNAAKAFDISVENATYSKAGVKPAVTVTYAGKTLVQGTDYTVTYRNNNKAALSTDKNAPYVTVKAKGNYAGTSNKVFFTIAKASVENLQMKANNIKYKSNAGKGYYLAKPVFTDNGKKLTVGKNKDILANCTYTYVEDTTLKDGTIKKAGEIVDAKDKLSGPTSIKITAEVAPGSAKSFFEGNMTLEYVYNVVVGGVKHTDISDGKYHSYAGFITDITLKDGYMTITAVRFQDTNEKIIDINKIVLQVDSNIEYGDIDVGCPFQNNSSFKHIQKVCREYKQDEVDASPGVFFVVKNGRITRLYLMYS